MAFLLKICPKVGARSIFWRSRAVETLAPLLEGHDEKIRKWVIEILLSMLCPEKDTSFHSPNGYSCMRHIASMSGVPMHIFRYFKNSKDRVQLGRFFFAFLVELKEDGVSCLLDIPSLLEDIVSVLREEGWLNRDSETAVGFLFNLVRFDRSRRVCSQLLIVTESIETLVRAGFKWLAHRMFIHEAVRMIFDSFTLEQVRVILTNPTVKEIMHGMILSLQNIDQSTMEFTSTLMFLHAFVKEGSGVEYVLSFPGSVETVVGFLVRTRKEQVESCSHSPIGIQKGRRKVLVEAERRSSCFLHRLVLDASQQGINRMFGIRGFRIVMIDLLDAKQVEETQVNGLEILWLEIQTQVDVLEMLSCDPEHQAELRGFMEKCLFDKKLSKLLLSRLDWERDIKIGVHVLCLRLSLLGNKVITETVESLVSDGLRELVCQLKRSDEDQEQQAFLFRLLLDREAYGWVRGIQIGGYFLGAAEALDRLVITSVYCQQESLRADALEILGICVCLLEDEETPLQIEGNQRQEQLQMILQAIPAILDQMSAGGYDVFLRFLLRLGGDCRQSSSVILKSQGGSEFD